MTIETAARAYAKFFAELTVETTHRLRGLAVDDLVFKDPFNDLNGVDRVIAMLDHMFETTIEPKFVINAIAVTGTTAFVSWKFSCRSRGWNEFDVTLTGVSELDFNAEEKLVGHIDHWDASSQLFGRLPLLGGLFRWLNRRFAAAV